MRATHAFLSLAHAALFALAAPAFAGGSSPSRNHAPVAADDWCDATMTETLYVDALANDTDRDGDALRVSSVTQGEHGEVAIIDGMLVYTPRVGDYDEDFIDYVACDPSGACDTALVTIIFGTADVATFGAGASASDPNDPGCAGGGPSLIALGLALLARLSGRSRRRCWCGRAAPVCTSRR